jgi:hypothetical protein
MGKILRAILMRADFLVLVYGYALLLQSFLPTPAFYNKNLYTGGRGWYLAC